MPSITVLDSTGATQTVQTVPAVGQGLSAASLPVVVASDQSTLTTGGNSAVILGSFARPANTTAYTVGQLVANSTTAGSVTPVSLAIARINQGTGVIRRVRFSTTKTGLSGSEVFRVHLFKLSPTVTNGDGATFSVNGVTSLALGYVDVTMVEVFNDGAKGYTACDIVFQAAAASQTIYALIEARSAYTPASGETLTVSLEVLQD